MADNYSFDIVSEVNLQEVDNAVNQVRKEIVTRFDFKGSKASIDLKREEKKIELVGDDDYKLRALRDMLSSKAVKRGVSLKSLSFANPEQPFGSTLHQTVDITMGIPKEKAKELVKIIKDMGLKVQPSIEGEKVRVFSPKKDELQNVIARLKSIDFPLALTFCNYR